MTKKLLVLLPVLLTTLTAATPELAAVPHAPVKTVKQLNHKAAKANRVKDAAPKASSLTQEQKGVISDASRHVQNKKNEAQTIVSGSDLQTR